MRIKTLKYNGIPIIGLNLIVNEIKIKIIAVGVKIDDINIKTLANLYANDTLKLDKNFFIYKDTRDNFLYNGRIVTKKIMPLKKLKELQIDEPFCKVKMPEIKPGSGWIYNIHISIHPSYKSLCGNDILDNGYYHNPKFDEITCIDCKKKYNEFIEKKMEINNMKF